MLDGHSRSRRKRDRNDYLITIGILVSGALLAYANHKTRSVPLLLGCTAVLAATCYWHRANPAAVRLLVGVVPVALLLGMTLAQYKGTKGMAADVTASATSAQTTVSANAVTGAGDIGKWLLELFIGRGE